MSNPVAVSAKGAVPWYGTPQNNNGSADKSRDSGVLWADIGNYARDQSGSFGKGEKDYPPVGNGTEYNSPDDKKKENDKRNKEQIKGDVDDLQDKLNEIMHDYPKQRGGKTRQRIRNKLRDIMRGHK